MNFEKTHHNFYNVCIDAIKETNDNNIMDKNDCIKGIEKLRNEKVYKVKKKRKYSLTQLYKLNSRKKELLTLQKILTTYQDTYTENKTQELSEFNTTKKDQEKTQKENSIPKEEINSEKDKKNINKSNKKRISIKSEYKANKKQPKRFLIFKNILEYLESNDITLREYIEHNPFQSKPYQISKSFEFLSAVKFQNYKYILEALQFSTDFLFSFDYYGQTCYHWAAKLSNEKLLMTLIHYGKYLNQKDFEGRTPLHLAAVNNDKKICDILIKNKANVHLKDNNGLTPADVAGSKELQYYLGDLLSIPYSNPSFKQRTASILREREALEELKSKKKILEEEEEKKKKEKENLGKEKDKENNE